MRPKGSKNVSQLTELYFDWQISLAHRYVAIQLKPSSFEHIDRAESEKCKRFSSYLRWLIDVYGGDAELIAEHLGRRRCAEVSFDHTRALELSGACDSAELVGGAV